MHNVHNGAALCKRSLWSRDPRGPPRECACACVLAVRCFGDNKVFEVN